jgi:asparagine synthase (glutamine-hydrolysing)
LRKDIPNNLSEQAEEFYSIFRDACKLRLISDVSVGTALSGGLDSSSVYSVVNEILRNDSLARVHENSQKAFVATFPGLVSDERAFAEDAVSFTKGPVEFLDQNYGDLAARVEKDTELFDAVDIAPVTSVSGIYAGMKQAGITVSLDGHGVDEMMYGYRDMIYNLYAHFCKKGDKKSASAISEVLIPTYNSEEQKNAIRNLEMILKESHNPVARLKSVLKSAIGANKYDRTGYLNNPALQTLGEPYDFSGIPYTDRIVYHETFIDTLPTIFRDFDRAGMMNSVEIRMPFMDWRLVSFIFSLPWQSKIGNGFTKLILREAMKGKMSENIRKRTLKIGIGSPVQDWFRNELKTWVLDKFNSVEVRNQLISVNKDFPTLLESAYRNQTIDNTMIQKAWQELNLQMIK